MKLKDGFKLHQIDDEYVVLAEGIDNIDFSKMISLNESAAYLWRNLQGKNITEQLVTDLLLSEYEVSKDLALQDAKSFLQTLNDAGVLDM
ncbi:MAG: PqqD family protein [Bacteroidia bacterium]|nr:PqqD family protein [Bacteroidia bacterium]